MTYKMFRIDLTILLAFALSSAAVAATCSNASLSGTYGLLHGGTAVTGTPTRSVAQITFDSTTATFASVTTASHDGVITTESVPGTYAVASNCTGKGTFDLGTMKANFSFVVTSTGFLFATQFPGATQEGVGVKQGSPTCNNAGVEGSFGFEATGVFVAGEPVAGPVAFIGELKLSVNASGDGVISGHVAGSEDGMLFTFAEEPVTGSYSVDTDCRGTATITPKGRSEMHFKLVVVGGGNEMLAIETDANTVVSGTLESNDLLQSFLRHRGG
jgi:hypothetical protein